VVSHE